MGRYGELFTTLSMVVASSLFVFYVALCLFLHGWTPQGRRTLAMVMAGGAALALLPVASYRVNVAVPDLAWNWISTCVLFGLFVLAGGLRDQWTVWIGVLGGLYLLIVSSPSSFLPVLGLAMLFTSLMSRMGARPRRRWGIVVGSVVVAAACALSSWLGDAGPWNILFLAVGCVVYGYYFIDVDESSAIVSKPSSTS